MKKDLSFRILLPALAVLAAGPAAAQVAQLSAPAHVAAPTRAAEPRTLHAARVQGGVSVDGVLDEAAWATAEVATGFVQRAPTPGAPAGEQTEARILYDDRAVYVSMRMLETDPAAISAPLGRRDMNGLHSDWASVMIDSYDDNRTAFVFAVNPRGVKKDYFVYSDATEDTGWDAVWEVETRTDSAGWTAEFRIPLSQLRFASGHTTWGVQLQRRVARTSEISFWSPWMPTDPGYVSRFGTLAGLEGLRPGRRLEVQPYTLGRVTRAPAQAANPFFRASALEGTAGADLKYGVTSNLTLTATLNPDFGQVESDPSQVNLTAFETLLDEKRPFFQEGADLFRFNLAQVGLDAGERLFYPRRVGRTPQRQVPAQMGWVDAPPAASILGAAKLSGKTSSGWSVGVLNALTGSETARISGPAGDTAWAVEPLTNYTVARVSRDFARGRSGVGGVFTSTLRDLSDEGLGFLHSSAYVGGVDGRARFGGGNHEVSGYVLGSRVSGSAAALRQTQMSAAHYFQRPDAAHLALDGTRTSLSGVSAQAQVARIGGGNWRWSLMSTLRTPGFDVNDVGYQQTSDAASGIASATYLQFKPGRTLRNWYVNVNGGSAWTLGGERTFTSAVTQAGAQLNNFWSGYVGVVRFFPALSPTALRGGPALRTPGRVLAFANVVSDPRKPLGGQLDVSVQTEDETGGRTVTLAPTVTYRPSSRADLSLRPLVAFNDNPWQFVPSAALDGAPHYLFGRLDQTTMALTGRLNYSFTPNLSLQLYAQPFVSAGSYSRFRAVASPRAGGFNARMPVFGQSLADLTQLPSGLYAADTDGSGTADAALPNPGFNVREFRSNAVLRWEYRPGSTLFVVWSQGRTGFDPSGRFDLMHDTGELFSAASTNSLLIKLSYWVGM
jgi:hypothetical protein